MEIEVVSETSESLVVVGSVSVEMLNKSSDDCALMPASSETVSDKPVRNDK